MSKYSRNEKLGMIEEYHERNWSIKKISEKHGISQSGLRNILKVYKEKGADGIQESRTGERKSKYSGTLKISIVQEKISSGLGYRAMERKYGVPHAVIMQWERIYLVDGEQGLLEERRGAQTKEGNPQKGRTKKLNKKVEQDLLAEVQQLRMENEYLKKLNALVKSEGKLPYNKK